MSRKRRLLRWSFALASSVSLILCLAFVGLRVRNHWINDLVTSDHRAHGITRQTLAGDVEGTIVYRFRYIASGTRRAQSHERQDFRWRRVADYVMRCHRGQLTIDEEDHHAFFAGYGFIWHHDHTADEEWGFGFVLPIWLFVGMTCILPAIWLKSFIRRVRIRPGHCKVCGYDLRHTPVRCPECGTQVA